MWVWMQDGLVFVLRTTTCYRRTWFFTLVVRAHAPCLKLRGQIGIGERRGCTVTLASIALVVHVPVLNKEAIKTE